MRALPPLGLGCASLGLREVSDDEANATLSEAFAAGITYFDTAPLYGAGLSERRLGQAIVQHGVRPFVSTKVGYRIDFEEGGRQAPERRVQDFSAAHVRQSLEGSLLRLGLDRVDLVYLHDPGDVGECADAVATLEGMRSEGLLGGYGVGANACDTAVAMMDRYDLDVVLIAGRFTLLDRSAEEHLMVRAAERRVALAVGGVFNSGILASVDPATGRFDYRPANPQVVDRSRRLQAAALRHGISVKAAALHFVADDPRVRSTLLGSANAAELKECLTLLHSPLSPEVLREIARA